MSSCDSTYVRAIFAIMVTYRLFKEPPELPLTEDVEIQTEIHPLEDAIDKNYCWNVWDLRRREILFVSSNFFYN